MSRKESIAPAAYEPKWVSLAGAVNVRDLGGLPAGPGKVVRPRALLRSDVLVDLTPDDVRVLSAGWGLRSVFDLRSPVEVTADGPSPEWGSTVRTHLVPFVPPGARVPKVTGQLDYRVLARFGVRALIEVLSALAGADAVPAVVHCSAGKDRTGVLVAVLLDVLGVDREIVVADFLATGERLEQVIERTMRRPSTVANPVAPAAYELVPDAVLGLFEMLDEHGGSLAWLVEQGAPEDLGDRLRARLLVDAPGE